MPIGGKSTHSVISAHSAFPTQTFFDYLTELDEGDAFYIHVLNRTLKYEVDQKKVVLPEETSDLNIIEEEDHVTLLTCTPYSINTHRLLVRGVRVADDEISVRNYFETLDYRVIDKKIVDEHDSRDLYIESGKQLLTLITCISNNNGGFDRYIVICEKKN